MIPQFVGLLMRTVILAQGVVIWAITCSITVITTPLIAMIPPENAPWGRLSNTVTMEDIHPCILLLPNPVTAV